MEDDQQIIEDRFRELPKELQDAILSQENQLLVQTLAKRYRLQPDILDALEKEIMLVLLGVHDPLDFPKIVEESTHLGKNDAYGIAQEINAKIFSPLKDALHLLQTRDAEDAELDEWLGLNEPEEEVDPSALDSTEFAALEQPLPDTVFSKQQLSEQSAAPDLGVEPLSEKMSGEPQIVSETTEATSIAEAKLQTPAPDPTPESEKQLHEKISLPETQKNLYKGTDPYREKID